MYRQCEWCKHEVLDQIFVAEQCLELDRESWSQNESLSAGSRAHRSRGRDPWQLGDNNAPEQRLVVVLAAWRGGGAYEEEGHTSPLAMFHTAQPSPSPHHSDAELGDGDGKAGDGSPDGGRSG